MIKRIIKIQWMHCASCSLLIEKTLKNSEWIQECSVSSTQNQAKITYNEDKVSFNDIEKIVDDLWYKVVDSIDDVGVTKWFLYRFIVSLILSIPIGMTMFINFPKILWVDTLLVIFSIVIVTVLWKDFHIWAWKQIKKLRTNMDTLVSLSTLIALWYSIFAYIQTYFYTNEIHFFHFLEWASFIITFILLGKYLEIKSKGNASNAIQKLVQLQEKQAKILIDDVEVIQSIDNLKLWDIIVVRPWEKIPVDGSIEKWNANINESMITGESIPVQKKVKDTVFSGTIVQDGILYIKMTKSMQETLLAKIVQTVQDLQNSKSRIQHLVDKISSIFVPVILLIALITFIVHRQLTGAGLQEALLIMVSTIVIACPCAMWLATPIAITVASGVWAKNGILIKSWEVLEKSRKIDMVVFDKTGTLTKWFPEVSIMLKLWQIEQSEILSFIYNMVKSSNHPLSKSVMQYISWSEIQQKNIMEFQEISGKWLIAKHEKKLILFWNEVLLKSYNIDISLEIQKKVENLQKQWNTVNYIVIDGVIESAIALKDQLKKESMDTISQLERMWIKTAIVSGDNENTVSNVAQLLWVSQYFAQIHPGQKASIIGKLQSQWNKVAFVWDGINDAPALIKSDLSIAMGNWSDIAIESAEIVLTTWDPLKVVLAIKLAKKAHRVIKQNLFWAFGYNVLFVPAAAVWFLLPRFAWLAMSMSSISVVLNSMRIRKIR